MKHESHFKHLKKNHFNTKPVTNACTPRRDDLYDLYDLHDLHDLYDLHDLHDLYDLYDLHDLYDLYDVDLPGRADRFPIGMIYLMLPSGEPCNLHDLQQDRFPALDLHCTAPAKQLIPADQVSRLSRS